MKYDVNSSFFVGSVASLNPYNYHAFRIIITVILFVGYGVKNILMGSATYDRGQIIPHILAFKTCALITYPAYLEYYDFGYGFMLADFPWANYPLRFTLGNPL